MNKSQLDLFGKVEELVKIPQNMKTILKGYHLDLHCYVIIKPMFACPFHFQTTVFFSLYGQKVENGNMTYVVNQSNSKNVMLQKPFFIIAI